MPGLILVLSAWHRLSPRTVPSLAAGATRELFSFRQMPLLHEMEYGMDYGVCDELPTCETDGNDVGASSPAQSQTVEDIDATVASLDKDLSFL
jgi:hypothetical protein